MISKLTSENRLLKFKLKMPQVQTNRFQTPINWIKNAEFGQ